jgi:hypothetical protein
MSLPKPLEDFDQKHLDLEIAKRFVHENLEINRFLSEEFRFY